VKGRSGGSLDAHSLGHRSQQQTRDRHTQGAKRLESIWGGVKKGSVADLFAVQAGEGEADALAIWMRHVLRRPDPLVPAGPRGLSDAANASNDARSMPHGPGQRMPAAPCGGRGTSLKPIGYIWSYL
jgi:hypothetical protein